MKSPKINQNGFSHILVLIVGLGFAVVIGYIGSNNIRESGAATVEVKAATYNLRSQRWDGEKPEYKNWSSRANRVKANIKKANPSLVSMQEVISVNPDTGKKASQRKDVVAFMKKLGYLGYTGAKNNSTPVFWRTDMFKKESVGEAIIFSSGGERASRYLTYALVSHKTSSQQVLIFSYHFNQFEGQADQLTKLAQSISTLQSRHPSAMIVFAGDFNGKYKSVMSKLKSSGVNLRLADRYRGVDHVLVSKKEAIQSFYTVAPGKPAASDHHMVVAELALKH